LLTKKNEKNEEKEKEKEVQTKCLQIEDTYLNNRLKMMTVYFGDLVQQNNNEIEDNEAYLDEIVEFNQGNEVVDEVQEQLQQKEEGNSKKRRRKERQKEAKKRKLELN